MREKVRKPVAVNNRKPLPAAWAIPGLFAICPVLVAGIRVRGLGFVFHCSGENFIFMLEAELGWMKGGTDGSPSQDM